MLIFLVYQKNFKKAIDKSKLIRYSNLHTEKQRGKQMFFNIDFDNNTDILTISFGDPSTNDQIVQFVDQHPTLQNLAGGNRILITGACSLPVSFVICHAVAHKFGFVGVFDPKLKSFVVAVSHDPANPVGTLIPA